MRIHYKILCLLLVFFTYSCGSKKKVSSGKDSRTERTDNTNTRYAVPGSIEEYIAMYAPIAREEMERYGIPASITLAQGILESGGGKSQLTRRANNHFGIKCHDWTGDRVYHDDDARGECFRKYDDPHQSFRDHSLFLTQRGRYAFLFDLKVNDYKGWAKGLRKAGYATDRQYPAKLISLIERYNLDRYDAKRLDKSKLAWEPGEKRSSSSGTYTVKKGDTLYSISRRFGLSVDEIMKYNKLRGTTISIGQRLSLEPR